MYKTIVTMYYYFLSFVTQALDQRRGVRNGGEGRPDLSDVLACIAIAEAIDRPKVDVVNILYECLRLLPPESREFARAMRPIGGIQNNSVNWVTTVICETSVYSFSRSSIQYMSIPSHDDGTSRIPVFIHVGYA